MANLLSIAALVVFWRNDTTTDDPYLRYTTSHGISDPRWCLNLNGTSLACGFMGNMFLLCNFTRKIRYIIALPVTIFLFYIASGILIGAIVGIDVYDPPVDGQVYSQGYWHAVIAACLYMLNAMLLMVNMLGYFLGHYPQHFDLTDEQRNLILQTMIFFIWLGGGAGVFAKLEGWIYVDALYFCDVTLLTIGFGDLYAQTNSGRGLVLPFSVGGTIILGLMVSSIHKFAQELSKENVVKKRIETRRVKTLSRAVTIEKGSRGQDFMVNALGGKISRPLERDQIQHQPTEQARYDVVMNRSIAFDDATPTNDVLLHDSAPAIEQSRFDKGQHMRSKHTRSTLERVVSLRHHVLALLPSKSQKEILMRSEKDRFDRMRSIQVSARRFRKWYALAMSIISFGTLWCIGALVFHKLESQTQGMSYFQGLYFCYVSLLTIGYGDMSPKSNAGKPFFIVWSLIAVPTVTILVSDLGDTAIGGFKRKVLEYGGLAFLGKRGKEWGKEWFVQKKQGWGRRLSTVNASHRDIHAIEVGLHGPERPHRSQHSERCRIDGGSLCSKVSTPRTINELVNDDPTPAEIMRRLALALHRVAQDLKHHHNKRYSYEEWVEFTRLIRFTRGDRSRSDDENPSARLAYDEAANGIVEWDWLDENSPMTSELSESEWVMDRLLESLIRGMSMPDTLASSGPLSGVAVQDEDVGDSSNTPGGVRQENSELSMSHLQLRPKRQTSYFSHPSKANSKLFNRTESKN